MRSFAGVKARKRVPPQRVQVFAPPPEPDVGRAGWMFSLFGKPQTRHRRQRTARSVYLRGLMFTGEEAVDLGGHQLVTAHLVSLNPNRAPL